jgi:hypothetical protein
MKKYFLFCVGVLFYSFSLAQIKVYDILSFPVPAKFKLLEEKNRLVYQVKDNTTFCQIQLWPAQQGSSDPEANFKTDWDYFAGNRYKIGEPTEIQRNKQNNWDIVTGVGVAEAGGVQFMVSVSTFTQGNISWCAITQLNDEKYAADLDDFLGSITADVKKFKHQNPAIPDNTASSHTASINTITKSTTNFDDGWVAKPLKDYVQLIKGSTELRLYYVDKVLDDAKTNMIDAPEYYWSHYVSPYYDVPSPQKWSGVSYPIVYFMEGQAVEKKSGRSCYVAIKIVYQGGAHIFMSITPDAHTLKQQFPHPNDMDRMLSYNKFGITAADVVGKWKAGTGGGIADYVNVYTGAYAFTTSLSTDDDFAFYADNTYHSEHYSASSNAGGTRYAALKYKGRYSATDWELTATNRVDGKTKKFYAQFVAVKNGFLLQLTDSDYTPLVYTLFRTN